MIQYGDYFMGRRELYPLCMSPAIEANAYTTVELANKLLVLANLSGIRAAIDADTGTVVASGWRPPAVNDCTRNAAHGSKHLIGQAIDIRCEPGTLQRWAYAEAMTILRDLGLWMEHPDKTPTWLHIQTVPPGSGNRVFWP